MNRNKRVTIIGGGLGGLTAGALLAKKGYLVTLLEQHGIVGGCATTFKRKGGFTCEVGLHEMDGVYLNPLIKKIFATLDVHKHVTFLKPEEFFAIYTTEGNFVMPDGINEAKAKLTKHFPHEKKGIATYFKTIQTIYTQLEKMQSASWYHYLLFPFFFPALLRYKNKTVSEVLDRWIDDDRLKLILNANVQYYTDTPDTLSFLLHSVAQYSYYRGGGWFIQGGSQTLSDYLASVITRHGGEVITKAKVISCGKNEVSYLHKKNTLSLQSDIVISNLSPAQTYALYDMPYLEQKEVACSLLSIYIGFDKNLKKVYGKRPYSNFIFDEIDSIDGYNKMLAKPMEERGFVFVDYSQIDAKLTQDADKSFGVICLTDYMNEWTGLSDDAYKAKKEKLLAHYIQKLETHYPDIGSHIAFAEVGTAKTVQRYIKTPQGTAYGFKPTPKQFFRIPQIGSKQIPNLYFVGQWVTAGGFSPSITSGFLCYEKVIST